MENLKIPLNLLPGDGRFGAGPSKVRTKQLEHLLAKSYLLGTSHRQAPVKELVGRVRVGLSSFFNLPEDYEVILGNGGATAFWEAAAFGLVEKKAHHLSYGEFSKKFSTVTKLAPHLEEPVVTQAGPGEVPDYPTPKGDIIAWAHNETSTGAMLPVKRLDKETLVVIDGTSAAAGLWVEPEEFDCYYFSLQKGFGSEGGLWVALLSPRALERVNNIHSSGRYIPEFLSLEVATQNSLKNQTYNTPAISTLLLLEAQLNWFLDKGGLTWSSGRSETSSNILYEWAESRDYLTPFVKDPLARSWVIGTIDLDEQLDAAQVSSVLRDNGVVDTEPYRKLGRNQIRVAMFPAIDPEDVKALTQAVDWIVENLQ